MKKKRLRNRSRLKFFSVLLVATVLIVFIGIIPLRLAITLNQVPHPQAIFVLGGNLDRMRFTGSFSKLHPALKIWVSDYRNHFHYNHSVFQRLGTPEQLVQYDFRATDTVTNFTSLVEDFANQGIRHLYLITSDYHMSRALAISTLVFGSRGIAVTPIAVSSSNRQPESVLRILRDCIRSLFWIATGETGASLKSYLGHYRRLKSE